MKTLFIKMFPAALHRELKSRAASQGRTLTAVVIEAVEQWLERSE